MPARTAKRPSISLIGSVAIHLLALAGLGATKAKQVVLSVVEFEPVEIAKPKPPPPPEEPEPKPPEPKPPEPRPPQPSRPRPANKRPVARAPVDPKPQVDEPPPRFELPSDQVVRGSNSGVAVNVGSGGSRADGEGTSKGKGTRAPATETAPGAPPWEPAGDLTIMRLPAPVRVPEIKCPAVREQGVTGTVVLSVQVRRDGSIRRVRVVKGMGYGCDRIAATALRRAKFKPAVASNGKPADYELRYEYVFALQE